METKKLKNRINLLRGLQVTVTFGPVLYYIILGLANGEIAVKDKVTLTLASMLAIGLWLVNVVTKHSMRSPLYLLILGIYFCIKDILPLIIMLLVGTVVDELLITPLKKRLEERYVINKEIDKRHG